MTTTLDHHPPLSLTQLAPAEGRTDLTRRPARTAARPDSRPAGWERNGDRRDRLGLALSELFSSRDDLTGVSTVADVLVEDLLWSV
jgi:hypothetical protein